MQKELLNVSDVIKILGISRPTAYDWIEKGTLKAVRIGKIYKFRPEDIDQLLSGPSSEPGRRKKVLAVDDDVLVRESLRKILEETGYEATICSNGHEAIAAVSKHDFDLIGTDVRMPVMNGIEMLRQIRSLLKETKRPQIPEMVFTGYADEAAQDEAKKLGIKEYLLKPFELETFISTIKRSVR